MEETDVVRALAALAQPLRLRAFRALVVAGPMGLTPSTMAEGLGVTPSALSFHLKELLQSGLVTQERTGRIARCNLDAAPLYDAAVWLNHYTKYWQQSFDALAEMVKALPPAKPTKTAKTAPKVGPKQTSKPNPKSSKGKRS